MRAQVWVGMMLAALLVAAGCGGSKPATAPSGSTPSPGSGAATPGTSAAAPSTKAAAPAVQFPLDKIVVVQGVDTTTMDPKLASATTTDNVIEHIYDNLVQRPGLTPGLAESWKAIGDKTWEVYLRKNVKFHNGEPFTAESVKVTIERIQADPKAVVKSNFVDFEKIEVVNDHTVRITTKRPAPTLPASLEYVKPVPPKYLKEVGDAGLQAKPVGAGPYKFVSWAKDREVVLAANPDYWNGMPMAKTLVFRPIPEAFTRVAEVRAGNADVISNVPPTMLKELASDANVTVKSIPSMRYVFIGINNVTKSPLQDQRVRQAMNYAIDKDAIVKNVLLGNGVPMGAPLHPLHFGFNPAVKPYPYDPAKAKALLAEAGQASGLKVSLISPKGRYLNDDLVAQAVAGQLKAVGIDVDLQILEFGTFNSLITGPADKVQLYLLGYGNVPGGDAHLIYNQLLHSKNLRWKFFKYPELDVLIDQGAVNVNQDQRLKIYQDLMVKAHDAAPWIYLHQQNDLYAVSKKLSWWKPSAYESIKMYKYGNEQ